jgi:hypothetical protein
VFRAGFWMRYQVRALNLDVPGGRTEYERYKSDLLAGDKRTNE